MKNPGSRALLYCLALLLSLSAALCASARAGTLEAVRARGTLVCGVSEGPAGYSMLAADGTWSGISVDFCRALAAAILGSKDAITFRLVTPAERFSALLSGEIDVLSRNIAMTSSRDTALGIRFPGVLVYDGLGFLARRAQGVSSARELSGAHICVTNETADEQGITDFFARLRMPVELMKLDKWGDVVKAYIKQSCQVLAADQSVLALTHQQLPNPAEHVLLPEIASKQPVGPAVRQGDEEWFSVVRWTIYALIAAEELGITSQNVDAVKGAGTAEARRFLGMGLDVGNHLGLTADWTQRIIKQVGNYGELFERNLGVKSPLKLERRQNNLASNGGLHYAPAFR